MVEVSTVQNITESVRTKYRETLLTNPGEPISIKLLDTDTGRKIKVIVKPNVSQERFNKAFKNYITTRFTQISTGDDDVKVQDLGSFIVGNSKS